MNHSDKFQNLWQLQKGTRSLYKNVISCTYLFSYSIKLQWQNWYMYLLLNGNLLKSYFVITFLIKIEILLDRPFQGSSYHCPGMFQSSNNNDLFWVVWLKCEFFGLIWFHKTTLTRIYKGKNCLMHPIKKNLN